MLRMPGAPVGDLRQHLITRSEGAVAAVGDRDPAFGHGVRQQIAVLVLLHDHAGELGRAFHQNGNHFPLRLSGAGGDGAHQHLIPGHCPQQKLTRYEKFGFILQPLAEAEGAAEPGDLRLEAAAFRCTHIGVLPLHHLSGCHQCPQGGSIGVACAALAPAFRRQLLCADRLFSASGQSSTDLFRIIRCIELFLSCMLAAPCLGIARLAADLLFLLEFTLFHSRFLTLQQKPCNPPCRKHGSRITGRQLPAQSR